MDIKQNFLDEEVEGALLFLAKLHVNYKKNFVDWKSMNVLWKVYDGKKKNTHSQEFCKSDYSNHWTIYFCSLSF